MSRQKLMRWSAVRLAQCRALYEAGVETSEIGAHFGITVSTVSVMAWKRKWRRPTKAEVGEQPGIAAALASASAVAAIAAAAQADERARQGAESAVTAQERNFNEHLRQTIAAYWRAQGRAVELRVEDQGDDLLGIRSKSVNGVPVRKWTVVKG